MPLVAILRQINQHLLYNLACVCSQTPLEINFIFRQKGNYWISKTRCIIAVYFPHNAINFIILSFSVQTILVFFINHVPIFKYPSWQDNGWTFFLKSWGGMRLNPFALKPLGVSHDEWMNEYGALVFRWGHWSTEKITCCPPQISHGQTWDWSWASMLREGAWMSYGVAPMPWYS